MANSDVDDSNAMDDDGGGESGSDIESETESDGTGNDGDECQQKRVSAAGSTSVTWARNASIDSFAVHGIESIDRLKKAVFTKVAMDLLDKRGDDVNGMPLSVLGAESTIRALGEKQTFIEECGAVLSKRRALDPIKKNFCTRAFEQGRRIEEECVGDEVVLADPDTYAGEGLERKWYRNLEPYFWEAEPGTQPCDGGTDCWCRREFGFQLRAYKSGTCICCWREAVGYEYLRATVRRGGRPKSVQPHYCVVDRPGEYSSKYMMLLPPGERYRGVVMHYPIQTVNRYDVVQRTASYENLEFDIHGLKERNEYFF